MGIQSRRDRYVEIDISEYVDLDGIMDDEDCIYIRNCIEDARGCLNRPERSPAEAIMYLDRALRVLGIALKEPNH